VPSGTTPRGWSLLRPYQQEDAIALASGKIVGLWNAPGVGKTPTALAALVLAGVRWPVLVVTKAMGRRVWPRDAAWVLGSDYMPGIVDGLGERAGTDLYDAGVHVRARWSPRESRVQSVVYSSVEAALERHPIIVVSYEIVERYDLWSQHWGALVLDEAHAVKGGYLPARKRKRKSDGQMVWSGRSARFELCRAIAQDVRRHGGPVWELTATPVPDRRRDLFGQLNIVLPNIFPKGYDFLLRYCDLKKKQISVGGEVREVNDSAGKSNTPALKQLVETYFTVRKREQIADQLPRLQIDVQFVPCDEKSVRFMGNDVETSIARAAATKLPHALDIARDYLLNGCKVAMTTVRRVLAHEIDGAVKSKKFMNSLPRHIREQLRTECVTGEVPSSERSYLLERFNDIEGCPAILSATSDCLLESIDLHKTHAAIILGLPDTPGKVEQLLGRFSRLGGIPVNVIFLIAEGTIDERIKELLLDKLSDTTALNVDTQGGENIARVLKPQVDEQAVMDGLRAWLAAGSREER